MDLPAALEYDRFHGETVPAALAAAQDARRAHGRWPHSLGREGHELAADAKKGRLWEHVGGQYEGVGWEFIDVASRSPAPAGEAPQRWLWKAGKHRWTADLPEAEGHAFLRRLYDRFRDGGYASMHFGGTLRKPPPLQDHRRLYRFFLDLDEHVADPATFGLHDAWVEACVGPLLEALWPGARWGWVRPTHVRAAGAFRRNAEQVRYWEPGPGLKGGIHVHVDAWVDQRAAEQAFNWIASMLRDQDAYLRGEPRLVGIGAGELELDPISWNAAPLRPNGTYKTVPCSPLLQTSKYAGRPVACPSACTRCRGRCVLLEGPAYWPRPEHDTLATFLLCSVAPPAEPAQAAPFPPWFARLMQVTGGGRGDSLLYSSGRNAPIDRTGPEGARIADAALAYFGRSRANALHAKAGGTMALSWLRMDDGPAYLIVRWLGNTVCYFRSHEAKAQREAAMPAGKRAILSSVRHRSNMNYWVFRPDGQVRMRCRSEKRDCCRHGYRDGKPVLEWTGDRDCAPLAQAELEAIFGRAAAKLASQPVAPPAGVFA